MNILDIGRRGLGKSTLAQSQACELNRNQIYFDPSDQFFSVQYRVNDLEKFSRILDGIPEEESYSIAYSPPRGNVEERWDEFASTLWEFIGIHDGAASFALVIDESHRLQSPNYMNDWLDEYIRRTPRRERGDPNPIDIIQTTHYPQDLHRTSWGESDEIYFFNVFDKRAWKAISEQFGDEVAVKVSKLATPKTGGREVLRVTSETGETELISDPMTWYCNIKRPPKPPAHLPEKGIRSLEEMYG